MPLSIILWQQNIAAMKVVGINAVHGANMGPTWVLSAPDGPHELSGLNPDWGSDKAMHNNPGLPGYSYQMIKWL